MATFVGVDWGSTGWISAIYDEEASWDIQYHPSFLSVWCQHRDAASILVDIPIGLVEEDFRECDVEAKELLGGQQQSVFLTPPRPVFGYDSYPEAEEEYEVLTGRGMTTQAWSIMPRIREVDEFFTEFPEAHGTHERSSGGIRESHPEVCFSHLGQGEGTLSKQDEGGLDQRLSILGRHCPDVEDAYDTLEARHIDDLEPHERRFSTDNRDDIVDAMGLAITAWLAGGSYQTLPEEPPRDLERKVPVEIVYYDPP